MNYNDFLGQPELIANLNKEMQSGQVVHAYLFTGSKGTGKKSIAMVCARALNCRGEHKPCEVCPSCRRFHSGNHPDITRLIPKKSISVDDIRALISSLQVRSYEAGYHVVMIEKAESMTIQAQNALLKTLETPPHMVIFFLIADTASTLLPTIISRCRVIHFKKIEEEYIIDVLTAKGIAKDRAALIARLADGSVGMALELEQNVAFWNIRDVVLASLNSLKRKSDVSYAAGPLKQLKDDSTAVLDAFELLARDLIIKNETNLTVSNIDIEDKLIEIANTINGVKLMGALVGARKKLKSNVSWPLVIEAMFLDILEG